MCAFHHNREPAAQTGWAFVMAARAVKIRHDEETRAKIQASQLLNRLHDHAFGEVELTPQQVRSIEILLKKAIPDLSAITLSGDDKAPIKHVIEWAK